MAVFVVTYCKPYDAVFDEVMAIVPTLERARQIATDVADTHGDSPLETWAHGEGDGEWRYRQIARWADTKIIRIQKVEYSEVKI